MTDIVDWENVAGSNDDPAPNGFPEGMPPSGVNDSAREVMAAVKRWYDTIGGILVNATTLGSLPPSAFQLPIGSIYFNADDSTNPATLFGYGTWEVFGQGRVMLGVGATVDDRGENRGFTQGQSGGEFNHVLSGGELAAHSHSASDAGHTHSFQRRGTKSGSNGNAGGGGGTIASQNLQNATTGGASSSISIGSAGSNAAHNNIQPFIAVNIWKRVADPV